MALTVEDGSIVANADSYVTRAEWETYVANIVGDTNIGGHGHDAVHEQCLRRAAQYMDAQYTWKGDKIDVTQELRWPRYISDYVDGFIVPSDAIPTAIKRAQMELAYIIHEKIGANEPYAETITGGAVKRKKEKVDVIEEETEYFAGSGLDRDSYPLVDQLVGPYVTGKAGGKMFSMALTRG